MISARKSAFPENVEIEFERNGERYAFLRWGQKAFNNFRVVPPGTGICHQVNLEYLAQTVWVEQDEDQTAKPWSLIRIRWWAPTRTPRWSTAWPFWAGVWAVLKPKPRCWASLYRC
jgi:hypothetical protein